MCRRRNKTHRVSSRMSFERGETSGLLACRLAGLSPRPRLSGFSLSQGNHVLGFFPVHRSGYRSAYGVHREPHGSASRCAYRAVVAACVCPSSLPIRWRPMDRTGASAGEGMPQVASRRTPSSPAALQTVAHGLLRPERGRPASAPGMICGFPSTRGVSARTASAAAER